MTTDSEITNWQEAINEITCCDCLDLMKIIPDKAIDLILTDPPYGIGKIESYGQGNKAQGKKQKDYTWNDKIPSKEIFDEMFRISKHQIIWGGNYFVEYLKNSPSWIVWDKENGGTDFADCELAWTSFKTAVRKFKWRWSGMLQEQMGRKKEWRPHPTQKPIELMRWCLSKYSEEGMLIFDGFAGSFTTAVACKDLKRNFISCDLEEEYCKIGKERMKQQLLF